MSGGGSQSITGPNLTENFRVPTFTAVYRCQNSFLPLVTLWLLSDHTLNVYLLALTLRTSARESLSLFLIYEATRKISTLGKLSDCLFEKPASVIFN